MMLLSKPVNKRSILLGKFFGILGVVFLAFMVMGVFMTVSLCVKESLDYHISLSTSFAKIGCATLFQLVFSFLQVAIICTIAIAGSVYLPLVSNLTFCMFIYIIGNLMHFFQYLFQRNEGGFPWYVTVFMYSFQIWRISVSLVWEVGLESRLVWVIWCCWRCMLFYI